MPNFALTPRVLDVVSVYPPPIQDYLLQNITLASVGYNQALVAVSCCGWAAELGAFCEPLKAVQPPRTDKAVKPHRINASRVIRVVLSGIVRNS